MRRVVLENHPLLIEAVVSAVVGARRIGLDRHEPNRMTGGGDRRATRRENSGDSGHGDQNELAEHGVSLLSTGAAGVYGEGTANGIGTTEAGGARPSGFRRCCCFSLPDRRAPSARLTARHVARVRPEGV